MKLIGATLWVAGLALYVFAAFLFDPSVRSYGGYGPERIVNMDLQQRQLLLALAGPTMFLAGIIIHVAAITLERKAGDRQDAHRPISGSSPAARAADGQPASLTDDELMRRYEITCEGDAYLYGEYRYTRLADAVAYAKLEESRLRPEVAAARMGIRPGDDGAQV